MHGIAKFDFDRGGRLAAAACLRDRIGRPADAGRFVVLDLSGSGPLPRLIRP